MCSCVMSPIFFFFFIFLVVSYFFGIIGYSKLILYLSFPTLKSRILPRIPSTFLVEMVLETKFWWVSVLIAVGVSLLLGPFHRKSWEIYTHTHIYAYSYFRNHEFLLIFLISVYSHRVFSCLIQFHIHSKFKIIRQTITMSIIQWRKQEIETHMRGSSLAIRLGCRPYRVSTTRVCRVQKVRS